MLELSGQRFISSLARYPTLYPLSRGIYGI